MQNIFEKLGDILRPDGKYYVDFSTGRHYYNLLPDYTYFAIGNVGNDPQPEPGAAYLFCNDGGTCLLPIIETATGLQVIKPESAGYEIKNGELIPA